MLIGAPCNGFELFLSSFVGERIACVTGIENGLLIKFASGLRAKVRAIAPSNLPTEEIIGYRLSTQFNLHGVLILCSGEEIEVSI